MTEPAPDPPTLQAMGAALCRSALVPALILDAHGTVRFANPGVRRLVGGGDDSPLGVDLKDLVRPEDAARAAGLLAPDSPSHPVALHFPGEGSEPPRVLQVCAAPLDGGGVLLVSAEAAPGFPGAIRAVAHDLNNILLTVMTFTDLLRADAEPGSQAAADLGEIKEASTRASVLVQRLFQISEGRDGPSLRDGGSRT